MLWPAVQSQSVAHRARSGSNRAGRALVQRSAPCWLQDLIAFADQLCRAIVWCAGGAAGSPEPGEHWCCAERSAGRHPWAACTAASGAPVCL